MKKIIRKEIIKNRKALSQDQVITFSQQIFDKLKKEGLLNQANTLLYMDFRNEVKTQEMIKEILKSQAYVLLPRVDGDKLSIHKISQLKDLVLSDYGILEPNPLSETVDYKTIELILAPGVAFDEKGFRLGYGGGFYDRLLSQKRKEVQVIALAFECQMIEAVPTEPHDYQMDMIVTEKRLIKP